MLIPWASLNLALLLLLASPFLFLGILVLFMVPYLILRCHLSKPLTLFLLLCLRGGVSMLVPVLRLILHKRNIKFSLLSFIGLVLLDSALGWQLLLSVISGRRGVDLCLKV